MQDSTGKNLLDPGFEPKANMQFLLFLVAVVKAVHDHAELLKASVASAGNDQRLGACEAPPADITVFLGQQLDEILTRIEQDEEFIHNVSNFMELGLSRLPRILIDNTDRNRTSPLAFTGNKFEFRAVPSSLPLGFPNTVLNLAVAESLNQICEHLESILPEAENAESAFLSTIKHFILESKSIRYEGNNYENGNCAKPQNPDHQSASSAPAALKALISDPTLELFAKYKVLTSAELEARYSIKLDQYTKTISIEANTMIHMINGYLLPSALSFLQRHAVPEFCSENVKNCCRELDSCLSALIDQTRELEEAMARSQTIGSEALQADFCAGTISALVLACRARCDELERKLGKQDYPFPSYHDLLFSFIK